jgi:hypothetical protein
MVSTMSKDFARLNSDFFSRASAMSFLIMGFSSIRM